MRYQTGNIMKCSPAELAKKGSRRYILSDIGAGDYFCGRNGYIGRLVTLDTDQELKIGDNGRNGYYRCYLVFEFDGGEYEGQHVCFACAQLAIPEPQEANV